MRVFNVHGYKVKVGRANNVMQLTIADNTTGETYQLIDFPWTKALVQYLVDEPQKTLTLLR